MTIETITGAFATYGYFLVFISLFFGIVGIPAPEESLLVIIGMSAASHHMSLPLASLTSIGGAIAGMLVAYAAGRWIGRPALEKIGPWIGLPKDKWEAVMHKYKTRSRRTLVFGYFLPGVRQVSPYLAGTTQLPVLRFTLFSCLGAILWVIPYVLLGYYVAARFNIPPIYISSIGFILFGLFIIHFIYQTIQKRLKKEPVS